MHLVNQSVVLLNDTLHSSIWPLSFIYASSCSLHSGTILCQVGVAFSIFFPLQPPFSTPAWCNHLSLIFFLCYSCFLQALCFTINGVPKNSFAFIFCSYFISHSYDLCVNGTQLKKNENIPCTCKLSLHILPVCISITCNMVGYYLTMITSWVISMICSFKNVLSFQERLFVFSN